MRDYIGNSYLGYL